MAGTPAASSAEQHTSPQQKTNSSLEGAPAPGGIRADQHDVTPLLHRQDLQALAQQRRVKDLARAIRETKSANHCPECFQC